MSTHFSSAVPRPWYREFYVWMVIFFPALAVVAGIVTIRLAYVSNDGLVTDDYYKNGKMINQVLARDDAAVRLGLQAVAQLNWETHTAQVQLSANPDYPLPQQVQAQFMHPTRAGQDHVATFTATGAAGMYRAPLPPLTRGQWHILLEADDWRLLSLLDAPATTQMVLAAGQAPAQTAK